MEQIDKLASDVEKIKEIFKEIRETFPGTPQDIALSTISDPTTKQKISTIRDSLPTIPQNIELSAHERHDFGYINRQVCNSNHIDEFIKIAVIMEDIYYGIFAKSGIYTPLLDHMGANRGEKNSLSYYYPDGEWRVEVYKCDGDFSFTYFGYFEENFLDEDDDDAPLNFECRIVSGTDHPLKIKIFHSFHDLIFFLIDIVLSNGEWTGGDE